MEETTLLALGGIAGAPIVLALVNALVKPWTDDPRFYVLGSLVLGIAWNVGVQVAVLEAGVVDHILWATTALYGVLTGLTASGLYSAVSAETARRDQPVAARADYNVPHRR